METKNGQYILNKLSLFYKISPDSDTEREIDLSHAFISVDVYESIWNQVMTGAISIIDSSNIVDLIPLYGNERIELSFATIGIEKHPIEYKARIYKISDKHQMTEHSFGVTLYFMSEEGLNSQRTFVQKGYEQLESSAIVSDIFDTMIKVQTPNAKPLVITDTNGLRTYTFGSLKPFEAISIICNESVSSNDEAGYLFYEDNKQFNFVPLEKMYQQDSVVDYYSRTAGMYQDVTQKAVETFSSIQGIKVIEETSMMDRLLAGQQGTTVLQFDLLSKQLQTVNYTREQFYSADKSLAKLPFKTKVDYSPNDVVIMKYSDDPQVDLAIAVRNKTKRIELDSLRCEIQTFGNSAVRVGTVCTAEIPNWNKAPNVIKNQLSGKFLITELHHNLSNTQYKQTLMIQKDAWEEIQQK